MKCMSRVWQSGLKDFLIWSKFQTGSVFGFFFGVQGRKRKESVRSERKALSEDQEEEHPSRWGGRCTGQVRKPISWVRKLRLRKMATCTCLIFPAIVAALPQV
jgi:hypothetical protein